MTLTNWIWIAAFCLALGFIGWRLRLNLARWIMVLSVTGAIVLGYLGWNVHLDRIAMEEALVTEVPLLARGIQVLSMQHTKLYDQVRGDLLIGEANPESYIRARAQDNRDVKLGNVDISTREDPLGGNIVDYRYTVKPAEADRGAERVKIANFLYKLEEDSHRMRVTSVKLEPRQRIKEHEVSDDLWKWEVVVTSRQRAEME